MLPPGIQKILYFNLYSLLYKILCVCVHTVHMYTCAHKNTDPQPPEPRCRWTHKFAQPPSLFTAAAIKTFQDRAQAAKKKENQNGLDHLLACPGIKRSPTQGLHSIRCRFTASCHRHFTNALPARSCRIDFPQQKQPAATTRADVPRMWIRSKKPKN